MPDATIKAGNGTGVAQVGTTTTSHTDWRIFVPPPAVGAYHMDNIGFHLTKKPSAWHRFWVRMVLGWVWRDNNVHVVSVQRPKDSDTLAP